MTQEPHVVICAKCSNPIRISVVATGDAPSMVECPYCHAENLCEVGGTLEGHAVPEQGKTYFWTNSTRLDATSGLEPEAVSGVLKPEHE